jgi:hypothetical protein
LLLLLRFAAVLVPPWLVLVVLVALAVVACGADGVVVVAWGADAVVVVAWGADAVVATGEGRVPIGIERHDEPPGVTVAWRPAYLATNWATSIA